LAAGSGRLPLPGGERGGVRGFEHLLVCDAQYLLKNAIDILQHLVVPKPQNEIAAVFQIFGPARVLLPLFNVLSTIQLDDQLCVGAAEIDNKSVERHLSPEFQAAEAVAAQSEPQRSFGIGLLPAQPTSNFDC